ncbi:MAG TPA: prepilin peptidase [Vicinamibacterales bacterium]|nr:prepilin peptidase [Vicinamibacterales bacterium]
MTPGVVVGLAGLAIGSFLNVIIHRLPRDMSIVWPGSSCAVCGARIRWYDNVPILGWLLLRGRCRDCRQPISIRYPLVELATLAAFLLCYREFGADWLLVPRLLFSAALIALFAIDLEHQILPNTITVPGIVAGIAFSIALPPGIRDAVIGAAAGGGALWLIAEGWSRLRGVDAMGFGDVKMLAMIGAFLGWKLVIVTFVLSSLIGGAFAAALLAARRTTLTSALPFGTFLAIAAFVAGLRGERLMNWYLSFYL